MNITSVLATQKSEPETALTLWPVREPVGEPPLRFYRQVWYLRFAPGEATAQLSVDIDASALKGLFSVYDYDARNPDEPALEAILTSGGDTSSSRSMRRGRCAGSS